MRLKFLTIINFLILLSVKKSTGDLDDSSIAILMKVMLPSMFGLFSNVTDLEYKSNFKEPCTFDKLLEIFSKLPPYFDEFGKKYSKKPELMAYYSMQLASTFLVNNGSLTMECLYNMLSLQTRLHKFSIDLMDHPEKNFHLVGLFGTYMKPMMGQLKQNAMMKIIDHVDRYEKNDNLSTISLFKTLNIFYIITGLIAILSNIFLIVILKKSNRPNEKLEFPNFSNKKTSKTLINDLNFNLRKRYKTRFCFIVISICHCVYIFLNFIIMSQAGLASVALKGLTKLSIACKIAFFTFPPTTAYNIIHQLYAWLLVYIIRKHAVKLRTTRTIDLEDTSSDDENFVLNRFQDRSQVPFNVPSYPGRAKIQKNNNSLFGSKRKNLLVTIWLLILLLCYNSQNLFFYALNKLVDSNQNVIYFCAFDEEYSDYYLLMSQLVGPWLNLIFFWILPLVLGLTQILFDICFLLRIKREQEKRYIKLKNFIEWPVYAYFGIFVLTQMPFGLHQLVDLLSGAIKFPFVFPLFIQMKFSKKVGLVVFEQSLIFIGLGLDLLVWLLCDKDFKKLCIYWINKRVFCRAEKMLSDSNSDKSSSDTSVTNPSKISNVNGYESSTLTSTTSRDPKKLINIADSIKATAAIPASIQVNSNYPYEDDVKSESNGIKMIDTDQDEFDNFNDLSIEKHNLERLSEIEQDEEMDRKNMSLSNPPSFNAAISRNTYKKGVRYDHQYQNV
ncbi:unnamed protein product [Brachionus calyciflorus]|uniref:Uncharacterized protein n=1 Tax=Brachionus calyciflorus TaxID=104777 RepID=A0A813P2S6_9BILA|nr:unnamed protein product [Brachionus calyciflorus]